MVEITKAVAGSRLADVPEGKQFWCQDGRIFKNLQELEAALRDMSEETFREHANKNKNDFSIWVRDVIGDEKLASDLQMSENQARMAKSVAERIIWLKNKARKK